MTVAKSQLGFILLVTCLLFPPGCHSSHGHFNKHVALFIFGDSLFDAGNDKYLSGSQQALSWPYGESYFNPPSGRLSNGRIIPDFIAEFAGLPLIPAYLDSYNEFLYGANFAIGGSSVLDATSTAGFANDLKTQLQYFFDLEKHFRKTLGDVKTERLVSDAVYVFSSGINDYSTFVASSQSGLHYEDFVGMMIGNLTEFFKGIHEKGGRKFGIVSLPPFGCAPANRALQPDNTCKEELNMILRLHNQALSKKLQELALQLEGFKYANYDQYSTFSKRINNPSKYGFKVGDTACCGSGPKRGIFSCGLWRGGVPEFELCDNPDDYVYFDPDHPSEAADRQFAEKFWSGDLDVTSPYNLKALFEGTNHDDAFL